jgi:hypothetical protein
MGVSHSSPPSIGYLHREFDFSHLQALFLRESTLSTSLAYFPQSAKLIPQSDIQPRCQRVKMSVQALIQVLIGVVE